VTVLVNIHYDINETSNRMVSDGLLLVMEQFPRLESLRKVLNIYLGKDIFEPVADSDHETMKAYELIVYSPIHS
jgi:hypothetical protein